jgi:hypothetical protein
MSSQGYTLGRAETSGHLTLGEVSLLEEQAPTDEFAARMVKIIDRLRDEGRFCESSGE